MEEERIFIVGDIHGCLDTFRRLMDKIAWRPDRDGLIFLGDYIDRGPDPKGVVDHILYLRKTSSHVRCLMGNHEDIFLEFLKGGDPQLLLINGGTTTLRSYELDKRPPGDPLIPFEHLRFYEGLIPWIELDEFYVVHAGFRPGVDVRKQAVEDVLWIRDTFIYSDYDFGKTVIFGHTPFSKPLVLDNKIGLDTGAVYGNRLTCLELPAMNFHSVEA
jgi:serine/threonine protein phosphatase 1